MDAKTEETYVMTNDKDWQAETDDMIRVEQQELE